MRALGYVLIVLASLLAVGVFVCWLATIWTGDTKWGETSPVLLLATMAAGLAGGITVSYSK